MKLQEFFYKSSHKNDNVTVHVWLQLLFIKDGINVLCLIGRSWVTIDCHQFTEHVLINDFQLFLPKKIQQVSLD